MKITKPLNATYGMVTNAAMMGESLFKVGNRFVDKAGNKSLDIMLNELEIAHEDSIHKLELSKSDEFRQYKKMSIKKNLIQEELESINDSDLDDETKELLRTQLMAAFSK